MKRRLYSPPSRLASPPSRWKGPPKRKADHYGTPEHRAWERAVKERAGFRCEQCGIATPRRLRGSKAPNAPQLDHIEPIAKGGEHSYRNTQCACRKCNAAKGMGKGGQLRLF